ncbi:MlaD family protein [Streptomyces sp. RB6PN25]|uniref:MlaD family protein n=1 Tax=Streptomyces humicola TaxID=2953240 RepID=A0ABT1PT19_9ACTN|nr:MlaD family protein [Streptomyces humicola]MCQ4080818.1 MlaD family protein [Streptomyces humicola]
MARRAKWLVGVSLVAIFALAAGYLLASGGSGYEVQLVMPNAANLLNGSKVEIDGMPVGSVRKLETRDNSALVTVSVDSSHAPLHTGSKAQVEWQGVLGERVVELLPGPASNPAIPKGSLLAAGTEQVELDQVLAALDPATRAHLDSTVQQLDAALKSKPQNLQDTLQAAGPAVQELGSVLQAVGQDGPAITSLISDLQKMTDPLAQRRAELQTVVGKLTSAMSSMATEQSQLQQALGQLPSTLDAAQKTMDTVPAAVDSTVPLLQDLRPATQQLTSVSKNLSPLLVDLRPTIAELGPVLQSANTLLKWTPSLLDSTHGVVPGVTQAADQLNPAVDFLRPYTPDLVGWLTNWGATFGNYDAQGHYFHALVQVSTSVLNDNPGIDAGLTGGPNSTPPPGMASGQGWVDANGSTAR